MPSHTASFPSTTAAVSAACDLVEELAAEWGLPHAIRDALVLVAGEAVDNAAEHGNQHDPSRRVTVSCALDGDTLTFCVEDEGTGMDGAALERADLPDDPLAMDGRGLFIMRSLAERVWVESEGRRLCAAWSVPPDEG